jgi:signal transduction histidine kinase/DNA-binding response OmpR family regulator
MTVARHDGASWLAETAGSELRGRDGLPIDVVEPEDVLGIGRGSDILIVDEHASNLAACEATLAPLGRTLVLVQSGLEARAALLDRDFALIILDISLPGTSGLDIARLARDRPRSRGTPILFIAAMSCPPDVLLEAYQVGALDFVITPIPPDVLRAKVSTYLRLQDRTQELRRSARQLREAPRPWAEKLQEATAALAEARTPSEVAAVAVRLGAQAVAASAAMMWSALADGSLVIECSDNVPASQLDDWRLVAPHAPVLPMRVLERRQPIWLDNEADFAREAPELIEQACMDRPGWAIVVLPLVANHQAIGVLSFSYEMQPISEERRRAIHALVQSCEQALGRARLFVAEAEARRAAETVSQRKDEFLAMLGHELRNPLAAMTSALDVIKLRDGALGRELSILDRQVGHLTHIVGDLVDVARITQGKITLRREPVDVATAIAHAADSVRPLIDKHQHDVIVRAPENLFIDADRQRLTQVLTNLLTNAVKYTPARGRIEIAAKRDAMNVQITMRDNGRGIPSSLLPNVFDVFVQGERSLDRREGGLGIGLALVRNLVELHGGTVDAHSDGPGTGSTFTVRWPRSLKLTGWHG